MRGHRLRGFQFVAIAAPDGGDGGRDGRMLVGHSFAKPQLNY